MQREVRLQLPCLPDACLFKVRQVKSAVRVDVVIFVCKNSPYLSTFQADDAEEERRPWAARLVLMRQVNSVSHVGLVKKFL